MSLWIAVFSRYIPWSETAGPGDSSVFSVFLRTLHPVLHSGCTSLHSRMGHLKEQVHYSENRQPERKDEACILPFLKKWSLRAVKQLRRGSFSLQIVPNVTWRRNTLSRTSPFYSPRAVNDPGSDHWRLLKMLLTNLRGVDQADCAQTHP